MDATHQPVLLAEVLAQIGLRADGCYVDATFGRGGHSRALMAGLGPGGRLLAFDRDPEAVAAATAAFGGDPRFTMTRGTFSMLERTVQEMGLIGKVDGILADLGVSSPQLDDARRGFSFAADGPLDMRMDPDSGVSAAEWIATVGESELVRVLREYGEERFARRIARGILQRRAEHAFTTTADLAESVARAVPGREPGKHPATRTFQAIRIAVNRELDELAAFLPQCPRVLRVGGRLCVISFHSLEDRQVKRFLRGPTSHDGPRGLPLPENSGARLKPVGRAIRAGDAELRTNPRARSAVLRVGERVA